MATTRPLSSGPRSRLWGPLWGLSLLLVACSPGEAPPTSPGDEVGAEVAVQLAPVREGTVSESLDLYGEVVPPASSVHTYTLPYEVVVDRVHVAQGQVVEAGAPLVEVRRTAAGAAAVRAARQAVREATAQLAQVHAKVSQGLVTVDEKIAAEGRLKRARIELASLRAAGQGQAKRTLVALNPGVVARLPAGAGATVAPGEALVETADRVAMGVHLFAETEDAPLLRPGMELTVWPVGPLQREPVRGNVTTITGVVDPKTRLVSVLGLLDGARGLYLNQFVRAQVIIRSPAGLVVPRAALVPRGGRYRVFVVRGEGPGAAAPLRVHAVEVAPGVDSQGEVLVQGDGLAVGQRVVTVGAHQLADGATVRVVAPPAGVAPPGPEASP